MAIKYTKGNPELEYTGADLFMKKAGDFFTSAKKKAKKVATAIPNALERKAKGDATRELDNITRAFGSVENYEKLYPDAKKRNDELRGRAYGN